MLTTAPTVKSWRRCSREGLCRLLVTRKSLVCALPSGATGTCLVQTQVPAEITQCNQQWLPADLGNALQLEGGKCTVYILGVCFWAPLQQQLVMEALQQVQPVEILVEQPPTNSELLLPHPEWVQTVMDYTDLVQAAGQPSWQQLQQVQQQQQWQQQFAAFRNELAHACVSDARVGKDIMDPFETFGYYAGLDFVRQPDSIADVLQLCGFLPGQEIVTAAAQAQAQGARLRCIDAPLRLQESWVRGLLTSFSNQMDEQSINSYQPLKDFGLNQQAASRLCAAAVDWDRQLAAAAQQPQQLGDMADPDPQLTPEQRALLLFKVSKATAAACLAPSEAETAQVYSRMSRLQPLKWRHFALRQQHMAQQIKEAAVMAAKQEGPSSSSGTGRKTPSLLVVVGRQHTAALRALWRDPSSALWRTQVPRSFTPSVVEPLEE